MDAFNALYNQFIFFEAYKDEHSTKYPFMDSALPIIVTTVVYLWFVQKVGPEWMKSRQPFNIDKIIRAYNIVQILLNGYIVVKGYHFLVAQDDFKACIHVPPPATENVNLYRLGYLYLFLKVFDTLDTLFFILRKKFKQITFLHLFHHSSMMVLAWIVYRYFTQGICAWVMFVNSFVHTVMYGYYQMALVFRGAPWLQRYKKFITQIQLAQFFYVFVMTIGAAIDSECFINKQPYAVPFITFQLLYNGSMVYLFGNFYYKAYIKKKTA